MSAYMHFSTEISKRIIVWHKNSQVSQSCEIGGKCLSNKTGFCVGRGNTTDVSVTTQIARVHNCAGIRLMALKCSVATLHRRFLLSNAGNSELIDSASLSTDS